MVTAETVKRKQKILEAAEIKSHSTAKRASKNL